MTKGLTVKDFNELEIDSTPANNFEVINFMKTICFKLNVEYNSLFLKDDKFDLAYTMSKLPEFFSQLGMLFASEYEDVNKDKKEGELKAHGQTFKKYISILNQVTGIKKEVLINTSPKLLTEISIRVLLDPYNALDDTFFLKKIFKFVNMMVE